ncbi:Major facilitator superfamily domain general substrate transporter [Penicillium concentricum]|uniref:Major facilitator superfamily domain general substrate transporter n=1 Tax=Penicillium concentricum TaxID=293559 RepID=A0A9W9S6E4_9EURO|nr:Major facilitator superfamily domain general substrate transporter [Penicillium concentricum]KAJ5371804.1 Major facilitator superfamily domain general substrate transporter [Penicillium concentricum]
MLFLPIQTWSANRFGRKPTILAGYIFMILGVRLQSASLNANMFIYSRLLVGIAGAWFQCAVILVTEIAYPSHRSLVTAIYMCQYYAGSSLSALLRDEACADGVVSYYLTLILDTIGVTSSTDQTLINGFLQLWNLIMSVVGACLVDRAGRRALFIRSTVIMLISCVFIAALSGSFVTTGTSAVGTAVIPFLFIYYAGYDLAFTPLLLAYPAEIWMTSLRAKGVAISMMSNYIALVFNQLINPIAFERIFWKYYFVFLVVLLVVLVVVWETYPETRGRSLEEIVCIFDGEARVAGDGVKVSAEESYTRKIEHGEL